MFLELSKHFWFLLHVMLLGKKCLSWIIYGCKSNQIWSEYSDKIRKNKNNDISSKFPVTEIHIPYHFMQKGYSFFYTYCINLIFGFKTPKDQLI